jgi:hypothetical protein
MEGYIREYCKFYGRSFDEMIQQYNLNKITRSYCIDCIITYKIDYNKDIIYKEDIPKIYSKYFEQGISREKFMEYVMKDIKSHKIDINNLTIEHSFYTSYLQFYYISTFLEHEPVDIKIALKD